MESQGDLPCLDLPFSHLRYEEEVSLRATAENEFVVLKKASSRGVGEGVQ
jgi:hypothetical protein